MNCIGLKLNAIMLVVILGILFSANMMMTDACDVSRPEQTGHGCRIDNNACSCAFGCKSEFRYANLRECTDALKGRASDVCTVMKPCLNRGTCIQVSQSPNYRCRCEGTGYWGNRCQRQCPQIGENIGAYPYECIVI